MNPRRVIALFAAVVLLILTAAAQKRTTTRRALKPAAAVTTTAAPFDTIGCSTGDIAVSGYDKPSRSTRESAFFTNHTDRSVTALIVSFTYLDGSGRTLHTLRRIIRGSLRPGQTRQLYWPSWDRQQSFHYRLSRRARGSASTPYDVSCTVDSIIADR